MSHWGYWKRPRGGIGLPCAIHTLSDSVSHKTRRESTDATRPSTGRGTPPQTIGKAHGVPPVASFLASASMRYTRKHRLTPKRILRTKPESNDGQESSVLCLVAVTYAHTLATSDSGLGANSCQAQEPHMNRRSYYQTRASSHIADSKSFTPIVYLFVFVKRRQALVR
jgi:hypothetical protein